MSKNEAAMDADALARLKRLAAKSTLILTHYGRKSGKPYEVKIWFVVDGDKVFIGTANVQHQWVRNVQKNSRIKLSVGNEKFEAETRFLLDPAERNRALAAMGRKYWMYSPPRLGADGTPHRRDIAQERLTEVTKRNVQSLIDNNTLASVANWADEVRPERDETFGWHFVDIPKDAQGFSDARDCYRPDDRHRGARDDHQNCVVDRIEYFKRVLGDKNAPPEERIEALKFIVHFVGDVHQPFHAIGEAKGGNGVHVIEFGSGRCGRYPCNLHSAWDSGLIKHAGMDEDGYVAHLDQLISEEHLRASGNPADWANESFTLAKAAWLDDGGSVDEGYYRHQIKVVDERLALAGLRLAALLNEVLGHVSPQEFRR